MATESKALAKREPSLVIKDTDATKRALISRFGEGDFGQALTVPMFIAICNKYQLNPWMGHITPFHGRPYIQHDGWLHLINREASGQLVGLTSRPATSDEYKQFRIPEADYFVIGTATRRYPGGNEVTLTRRALVRASETTGSGHRPIEIEPWEMAEKRARVRVLRSLFNDCMERVGLPPAVDRETGEIVEGEAIPAENGADWSRLWVVAREQDLDKAAVHDYFHCGPDDGELKGYAEQRAAGERFPLQQVVEDMADELQHRTNDPTDEERDPGPVPDTEAPRLPDGGE